MHVTKETVYTFDGLEKAPRDEVIDFIEEFNEIIKGMMR